MANQVKKLNGIAIGSIEKFNGATDSNIEKINGLEFTGSFSASYSLTEIGSSTDTKRAYQDGIGYGSFTTYDPDTDQHINVYGDYSNSNYGTIECVIKTASTYYKGTGYVYRSSTSIYNMAIYDATKQRLVVAYETFQITSPHSGYFPNIFTVNIGAKQSSTNPYDFASGDFTETDSSTSTLISPACQITPTDNNTGSIRFFQSNYLSYNPTYDVWLLTYTHGGGFSGSGGQRLIRAFYLNSDGSLTGGTEVEFDDYGSKDACMAVYDENISRSVLMYNDSATTGKIRVLKHTGTGSVSDRVALSLDSEISHYKIPDGTKGQREGIFAQYYPEASSIFHFTGSTDASGVRYFKLTGSDGGGYSKVGNSNDKDGDDISNLWYYLEAPGDGQSDHGGASMHYVKGRGRLVVLYVDDDVSGISGSYDAQVKGAILEWNATRYAANGSQRTEDIQLGYTGQATGVGVLVLSHNYLPPGGYTTVQSDTEFFINGAYGETHLNERPEGLFGTISGNGFKDMVMLKFLEPGTTGGP